VNDKKFYAAIAAVGAIGLGLLFLSAWASSKATDQFREVCANQGGTPAYNGQRWECLK
jgi:hypothetical protein